MLGKVVGTRYYNTVHYKTSGYTLVVEIIPLAHPIPNIIPSYACYALSRLTNQNEKYSRNMPGLVPILWGRVPLLGEAWCLLISHSYFFLITNLEWPGVPNKMDNKVPSLLDLQEPS